jgi:hypothetical protein
MEILCEVEEQFAKLWDGSHYSFSRTTKPVTKIPKYTINPRSPE